MFIFILLTITIGQQSVENSVGQQIFKNIWKNQWTHVDSYPEAIPILSYEVHSEQLCKFSLQELNLKKIHTLQLVTNFSEKQFRESFQDGRFYNEIPELLSAVKCEQGLILLTNDLLLLLITEENMTLKVSQSIVLNVPVEVLQSPYFMEYYMGKLIIIFNQLTVFINISLADDQNIQPPQYSDIRFNTSEIITIKSDQYLFIVTNRGLFGYEIVNDTLQIKSELKKSFITDIALATESIYILDSNTGLTIYSQGMIQIRDSILVTGNKLGIYDKKILVAQWLPTTTEIIDITINDKSWDIVHQFQIVGKVEELLIFSNIAILNNEHGSFLYFHSIPSQFQQMTQLERLRLPKIKQIFINIKNSKFYIKGITHHKIVYYEGELFIPSLRCISSQDFKVYITFLSAHCQQTIPQIDQLRMCRQEYNYDISIVTPILSNHYMFLAIMIFVFIIILLSIVLCSLIGNYVKYYLFVKKSKQKLEFQDPDNSALTNSINGSTLPIKKM